MEWIDSHAHIYLDIFDEDRTNMLFRAREAGVAQIYMPNIDSNSIEAMLKTEQENSGVCFAMMGLHPCSVKSETWKEELRIAETWLSNRPFCALGEIGMDLYWDTSTQQIQKEAFEIQCRWAMDLDIPIVVHSREAIQPLISIVSRLQDGKLKGVFHCFSGSETEAKELLALGFYLGIGGPLTYKKSSLPEVFAQIPLERVLLETDAPYLPPVPHRGQRNECAYLPLAGLKLAEIHQVDASLVANKTSENVRLLYNTVSVG
jgi:TatD DNase family protein